MMSGRLEVVCSAVNVTLQVAASLEPLYEAHFRGPAPEVQVNGGTVTLTYPRRRDLADGGLAGAAITLKGSLPWEIEFDSVSKLVADLSTLPLRSLDVTGSISEGTVLLPPRLGGSLSALRGAPARYASSVWAGSPFGCCSARPRPR